MKSSGYFSERDRSMADLAVDLCDREEPSDLDRLLLAAAADERLASDLLDLWQGCRARIADRARLARVLPHLPPWARAEAFDLATAEQLSEALELEVHDRAAAPDTESPWAPGP